MTKQYIYVFRVFRKQQRPKHRHFPVYKQLRERGTFSANTPALIGSSSVYRRCWIRSAADLRLRRTTRCVAVRYTWHQRTAASQMGPINLSWRRRRPESSSFMDGGGEVVGGEMRGGGGKGGGRGCGPGAAQGFWWLKYPALACVPAPIRSQGSSAGPMDQPHGWEEAVVLMAVRWADLTLGPSARMRGSTWERPNPALLMDLSAKPTR